MGRAKSSKGDFSDGFGRVLGSRRGINQHLGQISELSTVEVERMAAFMRSLLPTDDDGQPEGSRLRLAGWLPGDRDRRPAGTPYVVVSVTVAPSVERMIEMLGAYCSNTDWEWRRWHFDENAWGHHIYLYDPVVPADFRL
jgi:hypothetical protein